MYFYTQRGWHISEVQCGAKENGMLRIVLYLYLQYYFYKQEWD